jgi:radical SAM protein with 4Fe4S-binding SPASM domain
MKDKAFDVSAPWRLDQGTDITVTVQDGGLLGSPNHILRFDLYPTQVPSHPERHHGYWDVPMEKAPRKTTKVRLMDRGSNLKSMLFPGRLSPTWRGTLPMAGPAVLTVSVLDIASQPARTIHDSSSQHVLTYDTDVFSLVKATLQVTGRCNLRCRLCRRQIQRSRDYSHMPTEVVEAVISASRRLAAVEINADGEPLLNPSVPDILARLKNTMPGYGKVGLLTNGMLLNQKTARKLIDRGLDWIAVSIDGATKATMEAIRKGSRFERIVENVAFAVEYGKRNAPGGIDFCIQFTIHDENVREIPDMVRLAGKLGVPNLNLGHLIRFETGEFQPLERNVLAPLLEEAKQIGMQEGVVLRSHSLEPLRERQCPFLDGAHVHVSGDVSACSFRRPGRPEEPNYSLGNIKEKPLLEIWESRPATELRRSLAAGEFPSHCEPCCFSRWGCTVRV